MEASPDCEEELAVAGATASRCTIRHGPHWAAVGGSPAASAGAAVCIIRFSSWSEGEGHAFSLLVFHSCWPQSQSQSQSDSATVQHHRQQRTAPSGSSWYFSQLPDPAPGRPSAAALSRTTCQIETVWDPVPTATPPGLKCPASPYNSSALLHLLSRLVFLHHTLFHHGRQRCSAVGYQALPLCPLPELPRLQELVLPGQGHVSRAGYPSAALSGHSSRLTHTSPAI